MGVAAGADRIGDEHAVQPGVDDAVARLQRHSAAVDRAVSPMVCQRPRSDFFG